MTRLHVSYALQFCMISTPCHTYILYVHVATIKQWYMYVYGTCMYLGANYTLTCSCTMYVNEWHAYSVKDIILHSQGGGGLTFIKVL